MRKIKRKGFRSIIGGRGPKHRLRRIIIRGSIVIIISIKKKGGIMIITETGRRVKCMIMVPTSASSLKKETRKRGINMPISLSITAMRIKKAAGSGKDNLGIRRGKGQGTVLSMIASGEKAAHRTVSPAAGSKQSELSPNHHPTANTARMIDIGSMNAGTNDRWKSKRKAIVQGRLRRIR